MILYVAYLNEKLHTPCPRLSLVITKTSKAKYKFHADV
jgi:hypothetical protein